jgi:hypothetical protein
MTFLFRLLSLLIGGCTLLLTGGGLLWLGLPMLFCWRRSLLGGLGCGWIGLLLFIGVGRSSTLCRPGILLFGICRMFGGLSRSGWLLSVRLGCCRSAGSCPPAGYVLAGFPHRTCFASGGSSPEGQVSRMARGWHLRFFGRDSVRWAACHPVDLTSCYHTAPRGPHRWSWPRLCGFGHGVLRASAPLARRDRAAPGRRDGRQHSGCCGLAPIFCVRRPLGVDEGVLRQRGHNEGVLHQRGLDEGVLHQASAPRATAVPPLPT